MNDMSSFVTDDNRLFSLVGYIPPDFTPPTFIIPVFRDLESGQDYVQICSDENITTGFERIGGSIEQLQLKKTIIKRTGETAIFGIILPGNIVELVEYNEFVEIIRDNLRTHMFDEFSAFALSIAKIVEDQEHIKRLRRKIFDETPVGALRTKKYFLENNVVRDELYSSLDVSTHDAIRTMKIDINESKIGIKLANGASEQVKNAIGRGVTQIFKDFSGKSSVELSFDDDKVHQDVLQREMKRIRSGKFYYDESILDNNKKNERISTRDALVLIPQAFLKYPLDVDFQYQKIKDIASDHIRKSPISSITAKKIFAFEPVSMISAMLFRMWMFADIQSVRFSQDYMLHVCCFRIKERYVRGFSKVDSTGTIYVNPPSVDYANLYPLSFIAYLISQKIITSRDATRMFEVSSVGMFTPYSLAREFLNKWAVFCVDRFPSFDKSLALTIKDASD